MSFFTVANSGPTFLGPAIYTTFLATTAETGGDYFVTEALVPPDGGQPPHIHHNQVETFYIIDGQVEVQLADQVNEAKAGDFVHVSKGTPHRFLNRSQTPAKMIITFVPTGDIEQFFREAFEQTTDRSAPPQPLDDAFIQRMLAAAERHDIEILPPQQG